MNTGNVESRSAVPWWAAFGAPLVGVPLLVGLLALGSVTDANGTKGVVADEVEAGYVTEGAEALQATVTLPPVAEEAVDWRC